jgi:uncharacterized protein (DUF427 family)
MSLTLGTGPFGQIPGGAFNVDVPREGVLYLERSPRRIRGMKGGEAVVDSVNARLLHESGRLPVYWFPEGDVRTGEVEVTRRDERMFEGLVTLAWDAVDEWLEEDETMLGHARDPYHRVDVVDTSRHVRVLWGGRAIADTTRARVLFETGLPPRWYIPREDVSGNLQPSDLRSVCAYKGEAGYWSLLTPGGPDENLAWTYRHPRHDAARIKDYVAFFNERVDIEVDGEVPERPVTPWSRPDWWQRGPEMRFSR